jgi:hypothetical protein
LGLCFGGGSTYCRLHDDDDKGLTMFKYALLIGFLLPTCASAADMIQQASRSSGQSCPMDQSGNRYCIDAPPVEKLITDCDPGKDCHHMESGQHYSVQSPITFN